MNLLKKVTLQNIKLNKKRTIVTIIGIVLSVALITALTLIYASGIYTLTEYEKDIKGDFHAVVYDVPVSDLSNFKNNIKIETLNIVKNIGYAKIDSKNEYKPYAYIKAMTNSSLKNLSVRLIDGRLPKTENEILIPSHLETNGRLKLNIGDEITLNVGERLGIGDALLKQNNPFQVEEFDEEGNPTFQVSESLINTKPITYKIVGIIERPDTNIESYEAPGYTFITYTSESNLDKNIDIYLKYTKEGSKEAYKVTSKILELKIDDKIFEKVYLGNASIDELNSYLKEIENAKYKFDMNEYLIMLENNPIKANDFFPVVVIVLLIILVTSIFCIKTSFDISVTEKAKLYGMLSSIGASKKQIKKSVFFEATILGVISIPIGIICGTLASYLLIIISNIFLRDFAYRTTVLFKFNIYGVIISIILGIITIYLSAFRSALRASKRSPIETIRNSADIKINKKRIKTPKLIQKLFGIGGVISYKNMKRNKKKYRTTIISLIVSVSVFIALSSFMDMAFKEVRNELKLADFNMSLTVTESSDIHEKILSTTHLDNITNFSVVKNLPATYTDRKMSKEYNEFWGITEDIQNDGYVTIFSLGIEQYKKYLKELNLDYNLVHDKAILIDYASLSKYSDKQNKVITKFIKLTDFKKGDIIKGKTTRYQNEYEFEIAYVTDIKPFSIGSYNSEIILIISDEEFEKIENVEDVSVYYKSTNASKLQDEIETILDGENYELYNREENARMMNNLYTLVGIFLYGFITVISLIGITNIFNTITTSMELRRQEFAMLKSIGMTKSEFNRMVRLESLFIGLKSLIIGIPLGIILSIIIYKAFNASTIYKLPINSIIISIIIVMLLIFMIMKYSINKINKQNTIETIRNENI